jgi:hypothetical protein
MAKLRLVVTCTIEYEANPKSYPDCTTAAEMLAIDLQNDAADIIEMTTGNWAVTGEVLEE